MTLEQLREVMRMEPFRPFAMLLPHGTRVPVPHPEFLFIPPAASRTVWVGNGDGTARIIDLLLVSAIEIKNGKPSRGRRGKP